MNRNNASSAEAAYLASKELYSDAISYFLLRGEKYGESESYQRASELLGNAEPGLVGSSTFFRRLQRSGLVTAAAASFKYRIVESYERYRLGAQDPGWFLDNKVVASEFAKSLGYRTPLKNSAPLAFDDITPSERTVVKVTDGSSGRGCFLVHSLCEIWDVGHKRLYESWDDLRRDLASDLREQGRSLEDHIWIVEDLLYSSKERKRPARDIKCFSFYGQVELVRVIERFPDVRTYHWDGEGNPVEPLEKREAKLRRPGEFPSEAVDVAARLSRHVPAPFLRIDLLEGSQENYFGEFTPWPGTFAVKTREWDERLGMAWVEAEDRLRRDLLSGVQFPQFLEITSYGENSHVGTPS